MGSWNAGAQSILGYSEAEMRGQSADLIFTPEDRAAGAPEREAGTALADGRATNERQHLRKDGSRFWGSGVLTPMYSGSPEPIGFVKVFRDRTTERQMDEERERARAELQAALHEAERARAERKGDRAASYAKHCARR